MRFGSQTITVVSVDENPSVRDENNQPARVRSETAVRGCRVRPLPAREDGTNTDKVTDTRRVTAPVVPAIANLKPTDEIVFEGNVFQVSLARVFCDLAGRAHKATIEIWRNLA